MSHPKQKDVIMGIQKKNYLFVLRVVTTVSLEAVIEPSLSRDNGSGESEGDVDESGPKPRKPATNGQNGTRIVKHGRQRNVCDDEKCAFCDKAFTQPVWLKEAPKIKHKGTNRYVPEIVFMCLNWRHSIACRNLIFEYTVYTECVWFAVGRIFTNQMPHSRVFVRARITIQIIGKMRTRGTFFHRKTYTEILFFSDRFGPQPVILPILFATLISINELRLHIFSVLKKQASKSKTYNTSETSIL